MMSGAQRRSTVTGPRLLLIGPQGSGKGTQGAMIGRHLSIPAISTGDIFRDHVSRRTDLGSEVAHIIGSGRLVPDELTSRLVGSRLKDVDARAGFLLDGYPRNLVQVAHLDRILGMLGDELDGVIELRISRHESIRRLEQRALDEGRDDDTDEVIAHRLSIYREETAPVLSLYAERGLLVTVDGMGSRSDVHDLLRDEVGRITSRRRAVAATVSNAAPTAGVA